MPEFKYSGTQVGAAARKSLVSWSEKLERAERGARSAQDRALDALAQQRNETAKRESVRRDLRVAASDERQRAPR